MEKLLTNYLYEFKSCPLPGVGTLLLNPGHAHFLPGEKRMIAPIPFISLYESEGTVDGLHYFIAEQYTISEVEAKRLLQNYCKQLQDMQAYEELPLDTVGSFYMDENGKLHFKSLSLPAVYFPDVVADRVIHPDVAHPMLVGDTHTNSTAMTEMLQDEPVTKSRWWIAAVVLAVVGLAVIFIYYSGYKLGQTGNGLKVSTSPESKTYSTPR